MNISMETSTNLAYNITITLGNKLLPYDVVLHVIQFLFGLPTHSYIVWIIVTGRGTGISSEFFTLNISVCEIIFCLRSLTTAMLNTFPWLSDIAMFLSGFVVTGRFFQCLMCVERYLAVVHPLTFLKYKPLRYRVACSILIWMMVAFYCLFYLLAHACFIQIVTYLYILQFLLILAINLFCCLAVLRALKQSGPERERERKEEETHFKRRAFYIILISTVTLLITYVPSLFAALQYIANTENPRTGFVKFHMFHAAWFCATFNLYSQVRQTALL